jgi:hypothetical protein
VFWPEIQGRIPCSFVSFLIGRKKLLKISAGKYIIEIPAKRAMQFMDTNSNQPKQVTFESLSKEDHGKLFLVDCHLNNPPQLRNQEKVEFINQEFAVNFPPTGIKVKRFKLCTYKVGGFSDIKVAWPIGWKAPGANALGWLPKLEFGDPANGPYYNGVNPALTAPIAPFSYIAHDGGEHTPPGPG